MLRGTENLREILRLARAALLPDKQSVRGAFPANFQRHVRHNAPIGRKPATERQQVLRASPLHRRHRLGGPRDNEAERGGHEQLQPHFHQDSLPGVGGVHGTRETERPVERSVSNCGN